MNNTQLNPENCLIINHKYSPKLFVCIDYQCYFRGKQVCYFCLQQNHKTHKFVSLQEYFEQFHQQLGDKPLQIEKQKIEKMKMNIQERILQSRKNIEILLLDLDKIFQQIEEQALQEVNNLVQSVSQQEKWYDIYFKRSQQIAVTQDEIQLMLDQCNQKLNKNKYQLHFNSFQPQITNLKNFQKSISNFEQDITNIFADSQKKISNFLQTQILNSQLSHNNFNVQAQQLQNHQNQQKQQNNGEQQKKNINDQFQKIIHRNQPVSAKPMNVAHQKAIWRIIDLGNGLVATCSSDATCKIFDIISNKLIKSLNNFKDAANDIVYLKKSRLIAAVSGDNLIRIFSIDQFKTQKTLVGHESPIYTLYYDEIDNILISGGRDERIHVWNIYSGTIKFISQCIYRPIFCLLRIKDQILCGDETGSIHIFDYIRQIKQNDQKIHEKTIYNLKQLNLFNKDQQQLQLVISCSNDNSVNIFQINPYNLIKKIKFDSYVYDFQIIDQFCYIKVGKMDYIQVLQIKSLSDIKQVFQKDLQVPKQMRTLCLIPQYRAIIYDIVVEYNLNSQVFKIISEIY